MHTKSKTNFKSYTWRIILKISTPFLDVFCTSPPNVITKKWGKADPHDIKCSHLQNAISHKKKGITLTFLQWTLSRKFFCQWKNVQKLWLCYWRKNSNSCRRFDAKILNLLFLTHVANTLNINENWTLVFFVLEQKWSKSSLHGFCHILS